MSTIAQRNRRMAWKSARRLRGFTGIYSRGDESVSLFVMPGKTNTELVDDDDRVSIRSMVRDIECLPDELTLNDVEIKPVPGDLFTEPDGAVYEVFRLGGEPGWRWSDATKQIVRIHLQLVMGT